MVFGRKTSSSFTEKKMASITEQNTKEKSTNEAKTV